MLLARAMFISWVVFCCGSTRAEERFPFYEPNQPPRAMQFVVARGGQVVPANTTAAIEHAIQDGLEWVAVDIRRTADGKHVLFADERLETTTTGAGLLREMPGAALEAVDAGQRFALRFRGQKILPLVEALRLAQGRVNLLLTVHDAEARQLVEEIRTADMQPHIAITGQAEWLKQVRAAAADSIATCAEWQQAFGTAEWIDEHRPAIVRIAVADVDELTCAAFHARGVRVQTFWSEGHGDEAQSLALWDKLVAAGIDQVVSDSPELAVARWVQGRVPRRPVKMALHRGAGRYAPENTLPAFGLATRLGADFVEFDVRTARDGDCFLLHDATCDRTTDGRGPLKLLSSAEIGKLDAGSWFAPQFARQRVPSLEAFLDAVGEKVGLYCDAKDIDPEFLAKTLRDRGLLDRTVVYQGASYLARLKRIEPRVRAMPPLADAAGLDRLREQVEPYAVDVRWSALSADLIARCHAAGIQVFSDAIGRHERLEAYQQAMRWGIDTIQTDHPLRLLRAIELHDPPRRP